MPDPVSRLSFAAGEIDRVFGEGYAAANPEVVAAVMLSASLDWAAMHLATAVRDVAAALVLRDRALSAARISNCARDVLDLVELLVGQRNRRHGSP